LRFEDDPALHSTYRRSFERSWELLRIEHIPWFNFVYGALTGNQCEAQPAVAHLREWPLDLVIYSYQNSHRTDLKTPAGYEARKGGTRTFSPREPMVERGDLMSWNLRPGSWRIGWAGTTASSKPLSPPTRLCSR
jgi:hypothetical protein